MILELSKGHEFRSNLFEATILLFLFTEPNYSNEVNLRLTRRSGSAGVTGSSYSCNVLFGLRLFLNCFSHIYFEPALDIFYVNAESCLYRKIRTIMSVSALIYRMRMSFQYHVNADFQLQAVLSVTISNSRTSNLAGFRGH